MAIRGQMPSFDAFLKSRWPANVPEDCTQDADRDGDCLELRYDSPETWCLSCQVYDRLIQAYEELQGEASIS